MSASVDWADTAAALRELHSFLEQERGTDRTEDAAFANAAKLCEAWPLVEELLAVIATGDLEQIDGVARRLRAELEKARPTKKKNGR